MGESRVATRSSGLAARGLPITAADEELAGLTHALGHPIGVAVVRYLLEHRESLATFFTIDQADFETYRIGGWRRFRVVPGR